MTSVAGHTFIEPMEERTSPGGRGANHSRGFIRFWRTPINKGVDRGVLRTCELGPVWLRGPGVTNWANRWVRVVVARPGAWAQQGAATAMVRR